MFFMPGIPLFDMFNLPSLLEETQRVRQLLEAESKEEFEILLWKMRGSKPETERNDDDDWDFLLDWLNEHRASINESRKSLEDKGVRFFAASKESNQLGFKAYVERCLRNDPQVWEELLTADPKELAYALHDKEVADLLLERFATEIAKRVPLDKIHSPLLKLRIMAHAEHFSPEAIEEQVEKLDMSKLNQKMIATPLLPPLNIDVLIGLIATQFLPAGHTTGLPSIPPELFAAARPQHPALPSLYPYLSVHAKRIVTPILKERAFNEQSDPADLVFLQSAERTRVIGSHISAWTETLKTEIMQARGPIKNQIALQKGTRLLRAVLGEPGSLDSLLNKAECFGYLGDAVKAIRAGLVEEELPAVEGPSQNVDPITEELLDDPIRLPSSGEWVNKSTAKKLNADPRTSADPFTREPFSEEFLKELYK